MALLQTGKYGDAEKAFKDFNDNFKKSPYRMDALFWWGTSAFANEHYKRQFHLKINCFENSQKALELLMQ